jgi:hypothetical protein
VRRFAADNPAHSRIVAQALGVVHILVSGKATKYRLPEQPGQCVPTMLATACVGQNITRGQTEYVALLLRICRELSSEENSCASSRLLYPVIPLGMSLQLFPAIPGSLFKRATEELTYAQFAASWNDDSHPSAIASKIMAEEIVAELKKRGY